MTRLHYVALATVLTAACAHAADLPPRLPPPMLEPTPVLEWSGFYVGGTLGGVGGRQGSDPSGEKNVYCVVETGGTPCNLPSYTTANQNIAGRGNSSSVVGGPQVGYNYQFSDAFFVGGVLDFMLMNRSRNKHYALRLDDFQSTSFDESSTTNWLSTLRLRLGVLAGSFALYATGGLAVADVSSSTNNLVTTTRFGAPVTLLTGSGASSGAALGWTLGGGVEYRFADHWSVGLEYLYYRVKQSYDVAVTQTPPAPPASTTYRVNTGVSGNLVRAGLNYNF